MSDKSLVHGHGESYNGVEQGRGAAGGGCGGKTVDQGEHATAKPVSDTKLGERAKRAGACARTGKEEREAEVKFCNATPTGASPPNISRSEVGTVCASNSSTGLCGRQRVTAVPTAIPCNGQAGTGHRLASKGIPALLDMEEPPRAAWETGAGERDSRAHPQDELRTPPSGEPRVSMGKGTALS
jgi:hypothetical protein